MTTTIQASKDLKKELTKIKITPSKTYEELLWNLIEDHLELNDETH